MDFLVGNNRARKHLWVRGRVLASRIQGQGKMPLTVEEFESADIQSLVQNGRLVVLKAPEGYFGEPEEASPEPSVEEAPPTPDVVEEEPPSPPEVVDVVEEPEVVEPEAAEPTPGEVSTVYTREELEDLTLKVLRPLAADRGIDSVSGVRKSDIIDFILGSQ